MNEEQKYGRWMNKNPNVKSAATRHRLIRYAQIKQSRLKQEREYQNSVRLERLAKIDQASAEAAERLSESEVAAFQEYIKSNKHKFGKNSIKPYKRIAREVLGNSQAAGAVLHLMKIHFPPIYDSIISEKADRAKRLNSKQNYRGRKLPFRLSIDDQGNQSIEYELSYKSHEAASIGRPKRAAFIRYVQEKRHVKGEAGFQIKTFVEIGEELKTSPNSIASWMRTYFPAILARKVHLHSSLEARRQKNAGRS